MNVPFLTLQAIYNLFTHKKALRQVQGALDKRQTTPDTERALYSFVFFWGGGGGAEM